MAGLDGPVHWDVDAALSKSFRIREGMHLQLRVEAYNLTNTVMFNAADSNFGDSNFGQSDPSQFNIGRTIQYSLRFVF
jgi:hypothetical protein